MSCHPEVPALFAGPKDLHMPFLQQTTCIAIGRPRPPCLCRIPIPLSYTPESGGAVLETLKTTILFVSALFPIVNPLGGSPIFLALTRDYSRPDRRLLAQRITINSFILMLASFFVGTHILSFFGISLPVVQVGGGLIVIATGWAMLNQKEQDDRRAAHRNMKRKDILSHAFYPLTLPLTVGPGSISVAITLGANAPRHLGLRSILAAVIGSGLIAVTIFLSYGFADRLERLIGTTGMSVIMRLSSFLLVCIGVQIFWNGLSALLHSLPAAAH
jgi:multiple antibiotic resistance protein